jgi:hypothetical protein
MRMGFAFGLLLLAAFEVANVYFIMPMPGSQRMRSLEVAYVLYSMRWVVRGFAVALMVVGAKSAWKRGTLARTGMAAALVAVAAVTYMFNFVMSADAMFKMPTVMTMAPVASNTVELDRLVVGVEINGAAAAYPLQYIGYHHQVRDSVGGKEVLVTYCTVCRTGRVFDPTVAGGLERFRLVGMDHFNAMLEDHTTGSWWRQANGEAVAGPLKGTMMEELPSRQVTLRQWLALHPASRVMQADPAFTAQYAKDFTYERGTSRRRLTGTDPESWKDKSWVIGMRVGTAARAYDWNQLLKSKAINDTLGGKPVVVAVASDSASFYAFVRPDGATRFTVDGDSLRAGDRAFAFNGRGPSGNLTALVASQEFWHSWRTFNPKTSQYR